MDDPSDKTDHGSRCTGCVLCCVSRAARMEHPQATPCQHPPRGRVTLCGVHPLQRLIIDRLAELGLTYREAAERSSNLISFGRLNGIANGRLGQLNEKTIRGIALALDVPIKTVRESCQMPVSPTEFRLPARSVYLSPQSRRLLMDMTNRLLEAEGLKKRRAREDDEDLAAEG